MVAASYDPFPVSLRRISVGRSSLCLHQPSPYSIASVRGGKSMSGSERGNGPSHESPRALDAVSSVRQHPGWFFRSGAFEAAELLALLVEEATRGGAQSIHVEQSDRWVGVSADVDWLSGDLRPFYAPVSYHEGGRNSARAEVALTAFCDAVVTGEGGTHFVEVKNSTPGSGWAENWFPLWESVAANRPARSIFFLLPKAAAGEVSQSGQRTNDVALGPEGRYVVYPRAPIEAAVASFVRKMQDA
jgi:hypothetical protein